MCGNNVSSLKVTWRKTLAIYHHHKFPKGYVNVAGHGKIMQGGHKFRLKAFIFFYWNKKKITTLPTFLSLVTNTTLWARIWEPPFLDWETSTQPANLQEIMTFSGIFQSWVHAMQLPTHNPLFLDHPKRSPLSLIPLSCDTWHYYPRQGWWIQCNNSFQQLLTMFLMGARPWVRHQTCRSERY